VIAAGDRPEGGGMPGPPSSRTTAQPRLGAPREPRPAQKRGRSLLAHWETFLVLLLVAICASNAAASPYFLDLQNLLDSTQSFSEKSLLALGMALLIVGRDIDLSIAAIVALCSTVMGWLATKGVGTGGLVAASLLSGTLLGMFNGALVARLGLPAIVVTIGTVSLFRGISFIVLGDGAYTVFPEGFDTLGQGYLFGRVPYAFLVLLTLMAVFYVLLHRTRVGRNLYAYGQNPSAARYSGIAVDAHRFWFFTLNGGLCGLAAVFLTSRIGATRPNLALGWDLEAIAIVLLGGVGIFGGTGRMSGVILAIFVMGMLTFGLGLRNLPGITMSIVVGALLVASVALPAITKKIAANRLGRP
jgi:rhamnose transport system permease protein